MASHLQNHRQLSSSTPTIRTIPNILLPFVCSGFENSTVFYCATEGYYCELVNSVEYDIFLQYEGIDISELIANCNNGTSVSLCPTGYYCPTPQEKYLCTPGNYCGIGSSSQSPCSLGIIVCPSHGMGSPNGYAMFFSFAIICSVGLFLYFNLAVFSIKRKEYKYKKYTTFEDSVVIEKEQQRTVNMLRTKAMRGDSSDRDTGTGDFLWGGLSFSESNSSSPIDPNGDTAAVEVDDSHLRPSVNSTSGNQYVNSASGTFKFNDIKTPLHVSFNELNLYLKKDNSAVLQNIFGVIKPFNITALMGPSGAGKTTLLALLRGQAHYAYTSGRIHVNGKAVGSLVEYREEMAFVPQDDILYEELTVEDNIVFASILFNKRKSRKPSELLPMVFHAEQILGIDFIRNSIVGSPEKKGISGGQKKRVSVAMEMMKESALFFLDEPTSGLDSATSISLLNSLHNLSTRGVNIVATLHQPRQEIFDLISNLILLAPGGRLAYFGPPSELKAHLTNFDYHCPSTSNVADFAMDVLAGFVPSGTGSHKHIAPVKEVIVSICDFWAANKQVDHTDYLEHELSLIESRTIALRKEHGHERAQSAIIDHAPANATGCYKFYRDNIFDFRKLTYVAFSRQKKVYNRTFFSIITTSVILLIAGLGLSIVMRPVNFTEAVFTGSAPNLPTQVITGQLTYAILSVLSGIKLFGNDALMRNREETGGIVLLPYYLGKVAASYVEIMFYPFAFVCGYYSNLQSNATFAQYWGLFLCLHLALAGLANVISLTYAGKETELLSMAALVSLWIFGGVQPAFPTLNNILPIIGEVMNGITLFKWSFKLQIIMELQDYSTAWDPVVQGLYSEFNYLNLDAGFCVGMLVLHWIITNILAYLIVVFKRDNFKLWRDMVERVSRFCCCSKKTTNVAFGGGSADSTAPPWGTGNDNSLNKSFVSRSTSANSNQQTI